MEGFMLVDVSRLQYYADKIRYQYTIYYDFWSGIIVEIKPVQSSEVPMTELFDNKYGF